MPRPASAHAGFTLLELSIVLVIMGLLTGGIFAGVDLVKQSGIRATVTQLSVYDTSINQFRNTYNGLPGDLLNATSYGFSAPAATTNTGNNLIDCHAGDEPYVVSWEMPVFFKHLSQARLLADPIVATSFTMGTIDLATDYFPSAKIGDGAMWMVRQTAGVNYFFLSVPQVTDGNLTFTDGAQIPVATAQSLDMKLDDGFPTTGTIVAVLNLRDADTGAAAADNICVNTTPTPDGYNMGTSARQADRECMLRIQASFNPNF